MSNRTILVLVLTVAAALAAVLFYFYRPATRYNWSDSTPRKAYSESYEEPYGTQILYKALKAYFPGERFQDIKKDPGKVLEKAKGTYVFVGEGIYYDSLTTQRLLQFVGRGNTALLVSKTIPDKIMTTVYNPVCNYEFWEDYEVIYLDSVVNFSVQSPGEAASENFPFFYANRNKKHSYRWKYIPKKHFCDDLPHMPLGSINDSLTNFAKFPYGNGAFLLHTAPIAFSNFHLLRPEGRAYAEAILSHLPKGAIYWDACSRIPEESALRQNPRPRDFPDQHPLSFLLQQPALAWAWYLLIGLAGAYLLFRAKRRQRVIPVLPKNENSSYEFISTIANLHFREKNYRGICIETMKLFIAQVRERYGLMLSMDAASQLPRVDGDYFKRLAQVSEVPEAHIRDIFAQYSHCINYEPTEQMMVDLHLAIERFSKAAK
jgi:hypothetical protein